ncbi:MAG: Fic family protein [Sphingobacteriales bacterium]|nr:Fic family protein [Sphingobacteriales bacterium]
MSLEEIIQEYQSLRLDEVMDHKKFSAYALTHHSTTIEGSTLTEAETTLLLDEGITPKGKPLEHSLMVKDHNEALKLVITSALKKKAVTVPFIQAINASVLKSTGKTYNTPLGTVDASKGEFRKGNVTAGGYYFPGYDKVERLTTQLVQHLNLKIAKENSIIGQTELSFAAHFDLVSIHPFYDGNGRTSRLLMNYIQAYYRLPLGIVHKEDRADYFEALTDARKKEDLSVFLNFMKAQYSKQLQQEIHAFRSMKSGQSLLPKKRNKDGRGKSLFL